MNSICQAHASKPVSLVYFLLNGQLIKEQLLNKYLQLGDLITSRQNDPLVSSTLSITIPLNNLATIAQIVNSVEYRKFKIEPTKIGSNKLNSFKTDSTKDITKLSNYQDSLDLLTTETLDSSMISSSRLKSISHFKLTTLNDEYKDDQHVKHHQIDDGETDEKRFRKRRNELNSLNKQKGLKPKIRKDVNKLKLNKQETSQTRYRRMANNVNRKDNDACDQLLKNCLKVSKEKVSKSDNDRISVKKGSETRATSESNSEVLDSETRLNKTINQVNGLISLIQKNLNDSNLIPLKKNLHLVNSSKMNAIDSEDTNADNESVSRLVSKALKELKELNSLQHQQQTNLDNIYALNTLNILDTLDTLNALDIFDTTNFNSNKKLNKKRKSLINTDQLLVSAYSIKSNAYSLNLNSSKSLNSSANKTNKISSFSFKDTSSKQQLPTNIANSTTYKLSSISNYLPRAEKLIDNHQEDKFGEDDQELNRGLELSCVATIAQPIATTYDEISLEENNYFERKSELIYDLNNNDQPIYLQDEFSIPRICINEETLISVGQNLKANCTVNLIQHWSYYRLQPVLKWFINDHEVCCSLFLNFYFLFNLIHF